MTLQASHEALPAWRPASEADLAAIVRVAGLVHPRYPERPAVFADRLALHPSGVMLAAWGDAAVGYAIGHPWRGPAPLLDRCLGRLPERPDRYWVHDVALLPEARGLELGRAALILLRADAKRCGLRTLGLAAVGEAASFWLASGFAPTVEALPPCYGSGATVMAMDGSRNEAGGAAP